MDLQINVSPFLVFKLFDIMVISTSERILIFMSVSHDKLMLRPRTADCESSHRVGPSSVPVATCYVQQLQPTSRLFASLHPFSRKHNPAKDRK